MMNWVSGTTLRDPNLVNRGADSVGIPAVHRIFSVFRYLLADKDESEGEGAFGWSGWLAPEESAPLFVTHLTSSRQQLALSVTLTDNFATGTLQSISASAHIHQALLSLT